MEQTTPTADLAARRVAEQIKTSGVTVVWLCDTTGIPRSTLLRRLNGHTPFTLSEIDRIATALRVSPNTLLGDAA